MKFRNSYLFMRKHICFVVLWSLNNGMILLIKNCNRVNLFYYKCYLTKAFKRD